VRCEDEKNRKIEMSVRQTDILELFINLYGLFSAIVTRGFIYPLVHISDLSECSNISDQSGCSNRTKHIIGPIFLERVELTLPNRIGLGSS